MRGPRISRSGEPYGLLLAGLLLIAFSGCSSSGVADRTAEGKPASGDVLQRYEKTFNPADYDSDINLVKQEEKSQRSVLESAHVVTTAVPETIPGFRVQVILTQEIDQAVQVKDSLEILLPDEWAYLVFDSPYYKVRVGNYEDRASANLLLKKLQSIGFRESWIVPDNVLKNLPPKPPELNIEPENQIENHRQ